MNDISRSDPDHNSPPSHRYLRHTTGSYPFPTHFNLYLADQLTHPKTIVAEYADNKIIYASHPDTIKASSFVQNHLNLLSPSYFIWHIKINESKSIHTIFTLRQDQYPSIFLNNKQILSSDTVKYLGLSFDKKLNWSKHLRKTKTDLNHTFTLLCKLLIVIICNSLLIYIK